MKDLHWGESFTLRARPFNDGGYGPWADVEVHGGAGYSFKIMDNFPLQVLGLPHRGDPWSIAMMMPDVISSRRRPDALLPTNFDSVVNAQTVYADESRGFDAMFGGHPIHFRIEYDSEGDQECMSDEHGLVRLERLAPHVGRLPLAMLQQVDTIRLTNQSAIRTDAWTSMRRRGFNVELIEHAFAKGWINQWERGFYLDTWRKQKLSDRQMATRLQVNQKILAQVRTNR